VADKNTSQNHNYTELKLHPEVDFPVNIGLWAWGKPKRGKHLRPAARANGECRLYLYDVLGSFDRLHF